MRLDDDVGEAMFEAGLILLRWLVLAAWLVALVRALVGCGGAEFEVGIFPDGGAFASELAGDAAPATPQVDSSWSETSRPEARVADDGPTAVPTSPDAGAWAQDAGTSLPVVDAGIGDESLPVVDCTGPSSCPQCGYPRAPCCKANGACGCELGGAVLCL